jgi:hypothetical protein
MVNKKVKIFSILAARQVRGYDVYQQLTAFTFVRSLENVNNPTIYETWVSLGVETGMACAE